MICAGVGNYQEKDTCQVRIVSQTQPRNDQITNCVSGNTAVCNVDESCDVSVCQNKLIMTIIIIIIFDVIVEYPTCVV